MDGQAENKHNRGNGFRDGCRTFSTRQTPTTLWSYIESTHTFHEHPCLCKTEGTAVRLSHLLRPVGCTEVASAPTILLSPTCASGLMWALGRITVPLPMVTPEPKTTRLPLTFKEEEREARSVFLGFP